MSNPLPPVPGTGKGSRRTPSKGPPTPKTYRKRGWSAYKGWVIMVTPGPGTARDK